VLSSEEDEPVVMYLRKPVPVRSPLPTLTRLLVHHPQIPERPLIANLNDDGRFEMESTYCRAWLRRLSALTTIRMPT
jgi:hypothetical protein